MATAFTKPGKTTVALDVLVTIARLTTLEVPGVSRLSASPSRGLFSRRSSCEGICLEVEEDTVSADIYVVLESDVNIREVGRNIQHRVARAISEMIGMQVGRINIHVEDIDYPTEAEA
jgi:uncharacterized alkaline shock family protein YloU